MGTQLSWRLFLPLFLILQGIFVLNIALAQEASVPPRAVDPLLVFGKIGTGEGEFSTIDGVWVDPRGRIIITDKGNHRVNFFTWEGKWIGSFGTKGTGKGEFDRPTGVLVDSRDRIIISDQGNARIQVFDLDGKFLAAFGKPGNRDGEFIEPMGLARDRQGFLYVSDGTRDDVQVFDQDFNFIRKIGKTSSEDFKMNRIESVVISPKGDVYIADEGNSRIMHFDSLGTHPSIIGKRGKGNGRFVNEVEGLAIDALGYLYAVDETGGKIEIFTPKDEWVHSFGKGVGNNPGQFYSPDGIHYSPQYDCLLVADQKNKRIQVFRIKDIWGDKERVWRR
ncbi:MAG: 6-bladed beta-propeller [Deltaproteobacteria bacterium]|nr:6-bladed beta-propeller [Deltaproteobacteria bacterium]